MTDENDNIEELKALVHEDMRRQIREVESGKGGFLHSMFVRASKAQHTLDTNSDGEFVLPEMEEVYASYLPQILKMAEERGVSLKNEMQIMREQLIREADGGKRTAQNELAYAYEEGKYGLEKDVAKSFEYRVKAAENGSLNAIFCLNMDLISAERRLRTGSRKTLAGPMGRVEPTVEVDRKIVAYKGRLIELMAERNMHFITQEELIANPGVDAPDDPDPEWQFIPDYPAPEL